MALTSSFRDDSPLPAGGDEIVRQRGMYPKWLVCHGMRHFQLRGMEHRTCRIALSVQPVPDKGMANGRQVNSNLMSPAGVKRHGDKRAPL